MWPDRRTEYDRQTDRHDEANSRFSHFKEATKNAWRESVNGKKHRSFVSDVCYFQFACLA